MELKYCGAERYTVTLQKQRKKMKEGRKEAPLRCEVNTQTAW